MGEKAYLLNNEYYSTSTSAHQRYIYGAIPTGSKVFSVGYNMSNTGNMAFVTSGLESIKDAIEKYKKARTELPYQNVWGAFRNLMGYIEFFDMGTPKRLLKKSANEWLGTNHELSRESDKIKREHVRELKRIFQILLNHKHWKSLEPLMWLWMKFVVKEHGLNIRSDTKDGRKVVKRERL